MSRWANDTVYPLAEGQKQRAAQRTSTSCRKALHPRLAKDQHGANRGANRHERRKSFAEMPRDWRLGGARFRGRLPWR